MFNNNDIAKNREYRKQAMRDREQLAQTARGGSTSDFSISDALRNHYRLVAVILLVSLFIVFEVFMPRAAAARDLSEQGDEPFAVAMQFYRMGHYYYVTGSYEEAISEYQGAIANIPEAILKANDTFWMIYWELGNAQFKADQPADALVSYRNFLQLMDQGASEEAVEFVNELDSRIHDGTYQTMSIMEG